MEPELSILIITYNRPKDTLALLENLKWQIQLNRHIGEILLLNNASSISYLEVENFIVEHSNMPINYINHDKNLGVARGRNHLIKIAKYPFLLFLDDDVVFEKKNSICKIANLFKEDRNVKNKVGAITLNIFYYDTNTQQINAFPHKDYESKKEKEWFLTYYFIGAAHIIKKEAFEKAGNYPDDFFYGMEEYDLSYRLIDAGYKLAYERSVKVFHKETPDGRVPNKTKSAMMWYNKCVVAWRYLPTRYFYSTALMWMFQYLKNTKFNLSGVFKNWMRIKRIPKKITTNKISKESIEYLKKVNARLWY